MAPGERLEGAAVSLRVKVEEKVVRTLLERMALDVPRVRPAVISSRTRESLDELRRFRHAMRHLYGTGIDERRLQVHLEALPDLNRRLAAELASFFDSMESMLDGAGSP